MGVVNETVEYGVSQCWVADGLMPVLDGPSEVASTASLTEH